ncbi:hypothetical protein D3C78_1507560 [compost metagenome]
MVDMLQNDVNGGAAKLQVPLGRRAAKDEDAFHAVDVPQRVIDLRRRPVCLVKRRIGRQFHRKRYA